MNNELSREEIAKLKVNTILKLRYWYLDHNKIYVEKILRVKVLRITNTPKLLTVYVENMNQVKIGGYGLDIKILNFCQGDNISEFNMTEVINHKIVETCVTCTLHYPMSEKTENKSQSFDTQTVIKRGKLRGIDGTKGEK